MEMKKELYLTLKEAINNAVKHSNCKRLSLTFSDKKPNMMIVVKDDGNGFQAASAIQGNGLRNMKMRVERVKGRFSIDSHHGEGTKVEISIPFTLFG
jgi:signal transduction histidine kinase